ncbi:MAG: hypothetical protein OXG26_12170 [Caldilineaceae bacterium]|nr:hypothetical protein [Caldilineaceae bacterium]
MVDRFLSGVPGPQIEEILNAAPGDEIRSGKFDSPESSAALAVNTFGYFLNRAQDLPPLPGCEQEAWPATSLTLEEKVRFPWKGGSHPHLDVLITTPSALIGIESKRFEPFRDRKKRKKPHFSVAYWRRVWGNRMQGYEGIRDRLRDNRELYTSLDAAQLVKHAFALRTQVNQKAECQDLTPILFYLYAEPAIWPKSCVLVDQEMKRRHRKEIETFAKEVEGDEVRFISYSYRELLANWKQSGVTEIQAHAEAVIQRFSP